MDYTYSLPSILILTVAPPDIGACWLCLRAKPFTNRKRSMILFDFLYLLFFFFNLKFFVREIRLAFLEHLLRARYYARSLTHLLKNCGEIYI